MTSTKSKHEKDNIHRNKMSLSIESSNQNLNCGIIVFQKPKWKNIYYVKEKLKLNERISNFRK